MMKLFLAAAAVLVAGSASAQVPLFAAKCPSGITADSNTQGQVYVNGKVAKLIQRPDGQITAQSAGVYVDITPRGSEPPRVTSTASRRAISSGVGPDGATAGSGRPRRPRRVPATTPAATAPSTSTRGSATRSTGCRGIAAIGSSA